MRIIEKGQVAIREAAGLMPGTDVSFVVEDDRVVIRKQAARSGKPTRGERLVADLMGWRKGGRSADEIIAEMRGPSADEELEAARETKRPA